MILSAFCPLRSFLTVPALLVLLLLVGAVRAADHSRQVPLKGGWSDQELSSFTAGCVMSIVTKARRDYYARAAQRGNSSPKPFPEQELTASVQPMCSCIGLRIARSFELQEVARNPTLSKSFVEEAIGGGQCKPGGLLGAVLEQRIKK